ncbi:MAG: NAD(P)/FAD-dependent oxidoreductase [Acetivibrionales bacterium]|jgi:uncharacterized FAD-dependent dehydrogenase
MIRLSNIKIKISDASNANDERQALHKAILSILNISKDELIVFKLFRKSVDARKKTDIHYVCTVDIEVKNEKAILKRFDNKGVIPAPELEIKKLVPGTKKMHEQPVIIGMGPAGLFAGLILSKYGYKPIILERGEDVDSRTKKIREFWKTGILDTESNVQFGEGGAGTFSDGKLTTLINDPRCRIVLKEFVKAGAPPEILYISKPHIGTDLLKTTVKNIRESIIANGGEIRFKAKVTDITVKDGRVSELIINDNEKINCDTVLLAIGHSSRDTFEVLYKRSVEIHQKAFSIGVRIEHPQAVIDKIQYGDFAGYPGLGAADYKLAYHGKNGRSVYTFCMCPGGYVVAAASEKNHLVTNGMSEYKRDGMNANSALLVGITPDDFYSEHPLAGIEFQRKWEHLAFQLGGENYKAPVQLTGDFLADRPSTGWGTVEPTYKQGVTFADLRECLPPYVTDMLKDAILDFDKKIRGFAIPDGILTGVETRSSSPVRILRGKNYQSNISGLYPIGEGAGYAGGIISSAVDGIKAAEIIIEEFAPIKPNSKIT